MRMSSLSWGMAARTASAAARFTAGEAMSPWSSAKRAVTRSTLPSTAGSGSPKAAEATAPAV